MRQVSGHYSNHLPSLLIAAGLLLRLAFALLPHEAHLILLEDDAWMVASIARHWAMGHGITADGLHPTNGFHPLYPLTLGALPYLAAPDALDFGFRANVLICALLNTLALIPFYGLLRIVTGHRRTVALAGLAVMALNPFVIRVSVNGMETSLALLLLLALWWVALAPEALTPNPSPHTGAGLPHLLTAALVGILAGLAGLARLDNLLAAGVLGAILMGREVVEHRRVPLKSLAYSTAAGTVLLPYFARNLLVFGHLTPSSGRALSYMHSYRESFAFTSGLQLTAYQPAIDLTWAPPWVLLLALAVLVWMVATLAGWQRHMLTPILLYAPILTFYYAYLQQQGRPRYYVAVGFVVVLLVCAWLSRTSHQTDHHHPTHPDWRTKAAIVVATGSILLNSTLFVSYVTTLRQAPYLAQPAMYQAARWIAHNLPPNARLAAQNSGVFQYYSERVVLNADGKLNHEIVPVLVQRELDVYLRSKDVQYIVDLNGVAAYIEFYSSNLSEAPPHKEVSPLGKLRIYARLLAAKAGLGPPVVLDKREPGRVFRPFSEVAERVKTFPLPNDPSQAVVIYQLHDDFGQSDSGYWAGRLATGDTMLPSSCRACKVPRTDIRSPSDTTTTWSKTCYTASRTGMHKPSGTTTTAAKTKTYCTASHTGRECWTGKSRFPKKRLVDLSLS